MADGSSSFFNKKLSVRHQDIMHSLKKKKLKIFKVLANALILEDTLSLKFFFVLWLLLRELGFCY